MTQLLILIAVLSLLALADLDVNAFCKSETCEGQGQGQGQGQLLSIKSEEFNKCTFKKSPCSNAGGYVIIRNNQTHAIHTVYKDDKCSEMSFELVWACGKCTATPMISAGSSIKLTCDSGNVEIQQGIINTGGLTSGLTTSGFVSTPASSSYSVAQPVFLPPITQPLSTATTTTFPATTTANVLPATTSVLPATTTTVPVMTQPATVLPTTVIPAQQQGFQQGNQQPAGWNGQQAGFATGQNTNPGYQYASGPQPAQGPQGQGQGYRSGWQYSSAGSLFVNPFTFIVGLLAYGVLI